MGAFSIPFLKFTIEIEPNYEKTTHTSLLNTDFI